MSRNTKQYISIKDVLSYFQNHFLLFVVTITVSLSAAIGYVIITPPIYQRSASILIKKDEKGAAVSTIMGLDGKVVNNNVDLNNEVNILLMPQLMQEVVKRLSLQDNYSTKFRNVRWVDVYKDAPFVVELDTLLSMRGVSLNFTPIADDHYKITDLNINGNEVSATVVENYGDTIYTDYGYFIINKSPWVETHSSRKLYKYTHTSVNSAASGYSHALSVRVRDQSASIIDLKMTGGSRTKLEDVLNTLILVYNENWIKDKNLVTISTTNFINERVSIIEKELGAIDENISSYKSKNYLPDVTAVSNLNLQSSNDIFREKIRLGNQLSMAKYILQYMQNSTTENQLLPVNTGIEDQTIEEQILNHNDLLLRKNSLLVNGGTNNPIIMDIIKDLDLEKKAILASLNSFITTLNVKIENNRKDEILAQNRLSQNPSQELFLLSTGREQMVKEQLYLFLLQKREENELSQAFTAYNTKVLNYAQGGNFPIEPRKNIIILMGLAIGIMVPMIYLVLRESFNIVILDKADLRGCPIPYIGSIPLIRKKRRFFSRRKDSNEELLVVNNGRDVINESFRLIRTNLDFMSSPSKKCTTIVIASLEPASGKSFVALNLAASIALKNSKVLAVDADFRRGTLSRTVNSPKLGLVNYLNSDDANIDDFIVKKSKCPMLDILPMGIMPPNPTEILLQDKFEIVVRELKTKYDYIIFDCPPINIVSDAAIVNKFCDNTIFILRAGEFEKESLYDVEELYTNKTYNNISLLLNCVDYKKNLKYGYGKYAYYGRHTNKYGSYYHYGNKDKK